MQDSEKAFWRSVATATALLVGFAAVQAMPLPRAQDGPAAVIDRLLKTARKRGLNAEAREAQMAGYYEDLLNTAGDVVAPTPLSLDRWLKPGNSRDDDGRPVHEVVAISGKVPPINEFTKDYVIYRPKPNLDVPDPRYRGFRHQTNSFGFADREYPVERAPGTRRLVMLGDSTARGLGVPLGQTFDALLEDDLNKEHAGGDVSRFEFINMGVSGYRLTQIVDLALETVPQFRPDVYIVALTELSVFRRWDLHLLQIFDEGRDLKYQFLRDVVREAGLRRGEPATSSHAKLSRFMLPTLRWSLREIRAKAAEHGASVFVVILPTLTDTGDLDRTFRPVRPMLAEEKIPFLDLLDAYDAVDLSDIDAGDGGHANAAGHRMLFDRLHARLAADPALASQLLGLPTAAPRLTH